MDSVISRRLAGLYDKGQAAVLCMVVEESGSTPRSTGSSMLVFPGGALSRQYLRQYGREASLTFFP